MHEVILPCTHNEADFNTFRNIFMSNDSPLGKHTEYPHRYSPNLLYPIPRSEGRRLLSLGEELPFHGVDIWNAYELSWLNEKGKPVAAVGEILYPASSPNIVESKSLKLYLNSLRGMRYKNIEFVRSLIQKDLDDIIGDTVAVRLSSVADSTAQVFAQLPGTCIDDIDVSIDTYDVEANLLSHAIFDEIEVHETLHSHLLMSNCPVTEQPDWGSILLSYEGPKIDPGVLLKYLVSYRNHNEFHEHCVERIFVDVLQHCRPRALTVYARYTRRGGLDINPFRSNFEDNADNKRVWRQ